MPLSKIPLKLYEIYNAVIYLFDIDETYKWDEWNNKCPRV